MQIKKALITAAGPDQRKLAVQSLVDRDGNRKSVLEILLDEARQAGIEEIAVVIHPGDRGVYAGLIPEGESVRFIEQDRPLGYGYAVWCGREFTGSDWFLHLVGDHLWVNRSLEPCARRLVEAARHNRCAVSAVTPTRESLIPNFGTVGGRRVPHSPDLYLVERVIEKPTPTLAEQKLIVPGLRAGHYLCFFGMHVLPPTVMQLLGEEVARNDGQRIGLSGALDRLAAGERYLALGMNDWRFDAGSRYGLLKAQLALALSGNDREEVMGELLEFFASRS